MEKETIVKQAERLVDGELTLGELFAVTHEELMGTSSLALLMAAHGNYGEAHTIMEGLLALAPKSGFLFTVQSEVCQMEGDKERVQTLLRVSEEMEMGDNERIRRGELALWAENRPLAQREIERVRACASTEAFQRRFQKLQTRLAS